MQFAGKDGLAHAPASGFDWNIKTMQGHADYWRTRSSTDSM